MPMHTSAIGSSVYTGAPKEEEISKWLIDI